MKWSPSSSRRPRSPVCSQPPRSAAAVASGLCEVLEHDRRRANCDLADLADGQLGARLGIDDRELDARQRPADRRRLGMGERRRQGGGERACLGEAVDLEEVERPAERLLELAVDRRCAERTAREHHAHAREVVVGEGGVAEHLPQHGRNPEEDGDAVARHRLHQRLRLESRQQHDEPVHEQEQLRVVPAGAVERRRVHDVRVARPEAEAERRLEPVDEVRALRVAHALGTAGGAARVHDDVDPLGSGRRELGAGSAAATRPAHSSSSSPNDTTRAAGTAAAAAARAASANSATRGRRPGRSRRARSEARPARSGS